MTEIESRVYSVRIEGGRVIHVFESLIGGGYVAVPAVDLTLQDFSNSVPVCDL